MICAISGHVVPCWTVLGQFVLLAVLITLAVGNLINAIINYKK